ncbi:Isoprenylcysteine carboxyl methyltransferase family-domain-containing protein [Piptocephalis cylindrospora]|uniref:Protein-S-isoprenylcysteine O-methyltransferase n=1 Tax=Piptocephalis cylindrospora TaxID=1907219 RepID=A0A4P9Y3U5_9FUNG|nr:Isoprenylcysteine carboxyl methyltransferase family-domain-containing protein [Piptocephalis cylindrospora]|eukprot:RKP13616.1 Isoprenylcysteine carboxyl methyltransferase family-domain-containing protein [Piptocephalis cylindrospora]
MHITSLRREDADELESTRHGAQLSGSVGGWTGLRHAAAPLFDGANSPQAIAMHAFLLGLVGGVGVAAVVWTGAWTFGWYLLALASFHFLEFWVTALYNGRKLTIDSFLINHSTEYTVAHATTILEFWVEWWFFSGRTDGWVSKDGLGWAPVLGLVLTLSGQLLRSWSMAVAGSNFDHYVQTSRVPGHRLVTQGPYHLLRHPSYTGFLMWSVGTQLLLTNPVCEVIHTMVVLYFFHRRVREEERHLIRFFGNDYLLYRKRTWSGVL